MILAEIEENCFHLSAQQQHAHSLFSHALDMFMQHKIIFNNNNIFALKNRSCQEEAFTFQAALSPLSAISTLSKHVRLILDPFQFTAGIVILGTKKFRDTKRSDIY